jgi:NAD(P)-dependent dehydrogenase (short-subunit alcohol dehydrogenase family)
MRLANKIAIITGAASGIGQATAIRFAQEGAMVVIADIDDINGRACVAQITAAGNQAAFIKTDVSLESDLQQMVDFAVSTYGGLDILHNNAYWTDAKTAAETTVESWQRTLDVTLRPVFLASKLVTPHLQARGGGVILNTASVQSIVGFPGYISYQAAKGGVMSLTRALALELAPKIRVVAVLPGAINTPALAISDEQNVDGLLNGIPLRRIGQPEEIASAALFLASDEALYITGTGLVIDGGLSTQ